MFRKILSYGLVAGLIVGGFLSCVVVMAGHTMSSWGMAIGYASMLVGLSAVFIAVKKHRDDDLGGVIRFLPAFGLGLGISFVASVVYVLAWEAAQAITGMDFAGEYTKYLIEQQKAEGVSGAALDTFIAGMEQFKKDYANPLYRLPMTFTEIFPVGVLVSLISAALLRNRRFLPARRDAAAR
jgi:hypothetical protein